VIRRFWARHPRLADILIAIVAFLISVPAMAVRSPLPTPPSAGAIAATAMLTTCGCVALVWRRRWPVLVFAASLLPALVIAPGLAGIAGEPASLFALYSIAVYRSTRASWVAFATVCGMIALQTLLRFAMDPATANGDLNAAITTAVILLIGVLVGVNVGNRRRYLDALIDRSRQLIVERDQQRRLAAAAERARIAREMHDIVSHSLTVIVALAEGAGATADPERSRQASRAVATTAREALGEMRIMLGVLRAETPTSGEGAADVGASAGSAAPLAPLLDASLADAVEAARNAGFPLSLTVAGDPNVPALHRLAVLRIVQEGITNAMRYSRDPTFIRVVTDYSVTGIRIVVENDGARPTSASTGSGWGLQGLRERASNLGGTLTAGLAGPATWRLVAELPAEPTDG
jgi:signal transduction histidine kinase